LRERVRGLKGLARAVRGRRIDGVAVTAVLAIAPGE
jgi:hypothetical protein